MNATCIAFLPLSSQPVHTLAVCADHWRRLMLVASIGRKTPLLVCRMFSHGQYPEDIDNALQPLRNRQ